MGNTRTFLTTGGNILAHDEQRNLYAFLKPDGMLIRQATTDEGAHLATVCQEIEAIGERSWTVPELPEWTFVVSRLVVQDERYYKPETSCNGGDYLFSEFEDVYAAKVAGAWKFRLVHRYTTSSEFEYDQLKGRFQTGLELPFVINAPSAVYPTQDNQNIVLEQISTPIDYSDLVAWMDRPVLILTRDENGKEVTLEVGKVGGETARRRILEITKCINLMEGKKSRYWR